MVASWPRRATTGRYAFGTVGPGSNVWSSTSTSSPVRRWRSTRTARLWRPPRGGSSRGPSRRKRKSSSGPLRPGRCVRRLHGHTGRAVAVAFSPDGRRLATGGWDHEVKLWDVESGLELLSLKGHQQPVMAVVFAAAGATWFPGAVDQHGADLGWVTLMAPCVGGHFCFSFRAPPVDNPGANSFRNRGKALTTAVSGCWRSFCFLGRHHFKSGCPRSRGEDLSDHRRGERRTVYFKPREPS